MSHVRVTQLPAGHHLTEQSLQGMLGTSRAPIRAALSHLADLGVVEQRPNRGYFVRSRTKSERSARAVVEEPEEQTLYAAIARDRLSAALPEIVTENELMRRYEISRHRLRKVLERIAAEGWIERRSGYGWSFQQMINSVEAYRESYRLRLILEPAGLLEPTFKLDKAAARAVRERQIFVRDAGFRTFTQIELVLIHAELHETIARMSGNRFIHQAVVRQSQLRRLVEYNRPLDRERARRVCNEHLSVLDAIISGKRDLAARRMTAHLTDATLEKAHDGNDD